MSRQIRVVHLTDFHLLAEAGARLHGWDVQRALDMVLDDIQTQVPDAHALVLGGDLADDESIEGYARLNRQLATLRRPVLALAGNHDDPALMQAQLSHAVVHGRLDVDGWHLYALDSHIEGSEAGRIGARQLAELDDQLSAADGPALIFLHHPPGAVGSAWIDAIGLQDAAALAAVVARHPRVKALVCGHAHQQATLEFAGRPCFITPATMRQFMPGSDRFAEDAQAAPGYRVMTLNIDDTVESFVIRVDSARRACG